VTAKRPIVTTEGSCDGRLEMLIRGCHAVAEEVLVGCLHP